MVRVPSIRELRSQGNGEKSPEAGKMVVVSVKNAEKLKTERNEFSHKKSKDFLKTSTYSH